ncbi:GumC family protein [Mameliella alba]|uniref:GumC family protein n=1 Tax=Mameliella alba TaxID=561184 RepID=UPI000B52CF12|nr:polysaccharide biosynthesis tyrosine autokinase [Mameliella alba]OWV39227.1 chain-length determining protein [Mameliella alba]
MNMKAQAISMKNTAPPLQEGQDDDTIDLVDLVKSIWRGKWLLAFCVMVGLVIGGYQAYFAAVPKYAARTSLALQVRNQQVVDLTSVISGVSGDYMAMNTELMVIKSRTILENVVRELQLNRDPEFNSALHEVAPYSMADIKSRLREIVRGVEPRGEVDPDGQGAVNRAIGALSSAVTASIEKGTYIFNLRVVTEDPQKSVRIVNALAQAYIEDQVDVKFQATENATSWLSARVVELEAELAERQDQIKQMRSEMELVSEEGIELLNQRIRDLRDRVDRGRAGLEASEAELARLREVRAGGDPAEIAQNFDDPILTRMLNQAGGSLSGSARETFLTRANALLQAIENDIVRSRAQLESLETSLRTTEQEASTEFDKLLRLQQAERDAESTRTLYETFLTRLKETSLQQGLQQADSRVLSEASGGYYVSPQKSRILAMAGIIGFMVGLAIILARQYLHAGFRTSRDLEGKTGLPVLGQIPRLKIRNRKQLVPFLIENPTSAAVEAFRNLRTSVVMSSLDKPPQIILSTSAVPGEGKTTNALALAQNFAGLGKRVLLLEGDIRRQTLFEYFDFSRNIGGLVAVLEGRKTLPEVVVHDERMGIDILFGEKTTANAADIFSSATFDEFLQSLRKNYDYIIIDTPPVLVVPDARVLGRHADTLLFTVAWNRTSGEQIAESMRQLASVNVPITGLVLSQIDAAGMKRYGYGDRYGAYSGYGKAYYDA